MRRQAVLVLAAVAAVLSGCTLLMDPVPPSNENAETTSSKLDCGPKPRELNCSQEIIDNNDVKAWYCFDPEESLVSQQSYRMDLQRYVFIREICIFHRAPI